MKCHLYKRGSSQLSRSASIDLCSTVSYI